MGEEINTFQAYMDDLRQQGIDPVQLFKEAERKRQADIHKCGRGENPQLQQCCDNLHNPMGQG